MTIIHSIISWATIKRMNQIELFEKYPVDVQQEQLFNLLSAAKNTEWGRKYDYARYAELLPNRPREGA